MCVAASLWAEQEVRSIPAVRAQTPPVIDGKLDDPCWAEAPAATGFTEYKTERLAEEQTVVRILYDDTSLYVGFECMEPHPDKLQATERKYDRSLDEEDYVEIQMDTFHDHRSHYLFMLNTLGTRYDERRSIFGRNVSWDADWSAACTVGQDRWFAELAIPIGQLHFLRGNNVVWGINFHRGEKGKQEESTWSFHRQDTSSPQWFGELTGLDLSKVKVNREPLFETYISDTLRTEGGNETRTGVDVSLRLSPQFITAFALNPDFGQVEADPDTITLRDIERFLEERRPFFKEGAEIFRTPINIYYSRRIWDVDVGAKITGVGPNWNLGLLDVQGETARGKGNFLVARFARNVGENSQVGAMITSSQLENGYNRVAGLDASFKLSDTSEWASQALGMWDEEEIITVDSQGHEHEETVRQTGHALTSSLNGGKRPFSWGLTLMDVSEDFRPDLGYIPWRDIRGGTVRAGVYDDLAEGPIKWYYLEAATTLYENHAGQTSVNDNWEWLGLGFRNELEFLITRKDDFHNPYNNDEISFGLGYNTVDPWHSISGAYAYGAFQDVPYRQFSLAKPLKFGTRFTTTLSGTYRFEYPEDGTRDVWLWRSVNEYTFTWNGRLKLTLEKSSEERYNMTWLFSWLPRKNFDLYAVFTESRVGENEERGMFAKVVYRF